MKKKVTALVVAVLTLLGLGLIVAPTASAATYYETCRKITPAGIPANNLEICVGWTVSHNAAGSQVVSGDYCDVHNWGPNPVVLKSLIYGENFGGDLKTVTYDAYIAGGHTWSENTCFEGYWIPDSNTWTNNAFTYVQYKIARSGYSYELWTRSNTRPY